MRQRHFGTGRSGCPLDPVILREPENESNHLDEPSASQALDSGDILCMDGSGHPLPLGNPFVDPMFVGNKLSTSTFEVPLRCHGHNLQLRHLPLMPVKDPRNSGRG